MTHIWPRMKTSRGFNSKTKQTKWHIEFLSQIPMLSSNLWIRLTKLSKHACHTWIQIKTLTGERRRHHVLDMFKPPLTGADTPRPPQTSWPTIRITWTYWSESLKFLTNLKMTILGMDYMVKFLECKLSYLNNYSFY